MAHVVSIARARRYRRFGALSDDELLMIGRALQVEGHHADIKGRTALAVGHLALAAECYTAINAEERLDMCRSLIEAILRDGVRGAHDLDPSNTDNHGEICR